MRTVSKNIEDGDFVFCPDCDKERRVVLEKDDPDLSEPNLVVCMVCLEVIAMIEK